MSTQTWIELFGYLGSLLVLVSFLMTSVYKLRVVNTVGSVIFMTYALIIHSYPTAFMNFALVVINIRFLWKMSHDAKEYELVPVDPQDKYLAYLMETQKEDIEKCFPGLSFTQEDVNKGYLVICQNSPAGIVLCSADGEDMDIYLDYAMPQYQDFSIGPFLMEKLKEEGVKHLTYRGPAENHLEYLNRYGFAKAGDYYERSL